jgi:hypothetical protein
MLDLGYKYMILVEMINIVDGANYNFFRSADF